MKKFEPDAFVFKDKELYDKECELWERQPEGTRGRYPTKTIPVQLTATTGELGNSRRIIRLKRESDKVELCIVARDMKLILEDAGFVFVEDVRDK